jgi:glycosyltransferase involved in cell wall biosynthesis
LAAVVRVKQVLIAHQSTIPHYRVPFYNLLEQMRPAWWRFSVVYEQPRSIGRQPAFATAPTETFAFPLVGVRSWRAPLGRNGLLYQTFWWRAGQVDLVIVENALHNLSYPLVHLHQLHGVRVAQWGHGNDRSAVEQTVVKRLSERLKMGLARRADGFFAYTDGVRAFMLDQGLAPERVYAVQNSIDVNAQRRAFEQQVGRRQAIRREMGLAGRRILLFVGRNTAEKRTPFLLSAFATLHGMDATYALLIVGPGFDASAAQPGVRYLGEVTDVQRLAPIYVASDLFVFPGLAGLGPVQALCYDLPVITIAAPNQKPEFEYLTSRNGVIMPQHCSPQTFAQAIDDLFESGAVERIRAEAWPSISHLTLEAMAQRFIHGVSDILGVQDAETRG